MGSVATRGGARQRAHAWSARALLLQVADDEGDTEAKRIVRR